MMGGCAHDGWVCTCVHMVGGHMVGTGCAHGGWVCTWWVGGWVLQG